MEKNGIREHRAAMGRGGIMGAGGKASVTANLARTVEKAHLAGT